MPQTGFDPALAGYIIQMHQLLDLELKYMEPNVFLFGYILLLFGKWQNKNMSNHELDKQWIPLDDIVTLHDHIEIKE